MFFNIFILLLLFRDPSQRPSIQRILDMMKYFHSVDDFSNLTDHNIDKKEEKTTISTNTSSILIITIQNENDLKLVINNISEKIIFYSIDIEPM